MDGLKTWAFLVLDGLKLRAFSVLDCFDRLRDLDVL